MTAFLTEEQLAELEWLESAATPGPWRWWITDCHTRLGTDECDAAVASGFSNADDGVDHIAIFSEDREVIVAARNLLPALLAEVRRLRELVADYEASEASQMDWIYREDR